MKTLNKTLIALALGSLVSVGAQAAFDYSSGEPYVGVKAGQFNFDVDGADDPVAYGVYAGYNFDNNFGAEIEYVGSDEEDFYNGNIDAKTYGAYGTYRYMFQDTGMYAKAKLGVARTEVEGDYTTLVATSPTTTVETSVSGEEKDTRLAGGLGLGYAVNPQFGVEAEYDFLSSDVDLWTVGATFKF